MSDQNQEIQDILGDFRTTVREFAKEALDGLFRNGLKGMESSIGDALNALYIRGREALLKKDDK